MKKQRSGDNSEKHRERESHSTPWRRYQCLRGRRRRPSGGQTFLNQIALNLPVFERCGAGCYVVVADSIVTGAHPGTERDVTWESETTGLTVRETMDRRIGGAFPYRMHLVVRLIR